MTQGKAKMVETFLYIDIHPFTGKRKRALRITKYALIKNILNNCGMDYCDLNNTLTSVQAPLETY